MLKFPTIVNCLRTMFLQTFCCMEQKQKNERYKKIKYKLLDQKTVYISHSLRRLGLHNWNGSGVLFGQGVNSESFLKNIGVFKR